MLEPGPAFAHAIEDQLRSGAVGDVGGREIDHQQAAVGIDRNVSLASDDLLAGIVTSCFFGWSLIDWLSITPPVGLASRPERSRSSISTTSWIV